jgi:hypothetical protein
VIRVSVRSSVLALAVSAVVSLAGVGAASAFAAGKCESCRPWWHLSVTSSPASKPGGEGTILVKATNLGDGLVEAKAHPVSIVDTLPPGVSVTTGCIQVVVQESGKYNNPNCTEANKGNKGVSPAEGEWELGLNIHGEGQTVSINGSNPATTPKFGCSLAGQTVTCTDSSGQVPAYQALTVAINVHVAKGQGGELNAAGVSGGGAPAVSLNRPLALGDTPPPFGVEQYELTPEEEGGGPDTQAGSHPFQLTTTIAVNSETEPTQAIKGGTFPEVVPIESFTKDLRFNLPPGLLGNPVPLPKCPTKVFLEFPNAHCPSNTAVGVASVLVSGNTHVPFFTNSLYSLETPVGEPARFGFQTGAGPVFLDASVRTGGDYGVVITAANLTQTLEFVSAQVTFWGVPADERHDSARGDTCLRQLVQQKGGFGGPGPIEDSSCSAEEAEKPFLIMPTSCAGPLHTSVEGDSWERPGVFTAPREYVFQNVEGELLEQAGCSRLSFEPSIKVSPDGTQGSSPTGLEVDVHVPQDASLDPTGLAEAAVKDTTVALPVGVTLNPAAADGLLACGLGEIALESPGEQTCPEASKVGTVKIKTPLLPNELEGAAYLAAQNANPFGSLVALYLSVYDPQSGVRVRLAGEVKPDPVTGQLVSTFKSTPQLPFEDLTLHFFGGSRAPLGTPAACGSYAASASFVPWSGNAAANVSSPPFNITSGPGGSPCSNPLPFSPSLTTGALNLQAGAFTPFTTTMSRADGQQNLQGIQLHMPPGLSGLLTGVKLCGEAEANAGTCGPESLIGETTVSVGLGGNPYSVKGGRVYITGPHDGAPFGLSIVNPAKAGPYDLEKETACDCLVVRAKIEVDPHTAALTITTDNTGPYKIPTILQGIPLEIQHVNVIISREHFTFNPTNCSKTAITGSLASTEGASSALSVPFQVTNCAILKFAPKFAVSTSGKTSRANGASLAVKLTYPKAAFGSQANIRSVKVDLPKQLPSRLTTLQKACTAAQFEANPAGCPAASIVGHAKAVTPLIPVPLTGPAYFVSHGGEAFPSLIIVLQGYGVTLDLVGSTFISRAGITSSTFKTVPDAPVGSFELILPEGKFSALGTNKKLCAQKLAMPTAFVAQNGAEIHESTKISVTGCPKAKKAKKHNKHGKGGKSKGKKGKK